MFLRHRYLSPDGLQNKQHLEKESAKGTSPASVARYSSARLLERLSADHRDTYSNLRKRIEQYSYNLSDLIGQGYTSRVYKASSDMSNQLFAIKVVQLKKYTSSNREMLESEVSILRVMDHPNIIKCHDVYLTNNNCYIITQYCEGGDLSSLLKKHSRGEIVSDSRMASIVRDVFQGFRYLVDKGIVHRDIKPANIFFKNGVAKIADFGFAKRLTALKEKESYNVGTPLYMPPEALLNNCYSLKSDIFSIGVLLFQMLFNRAPWDGKTEKQLINKMTKYPLKIPNDISYDLKRLLQGCLAVDQKTRFNTEQLFSCDFIQSLLGNPQQVQPLRPYLYPRPSVGKKETESTVSTTQGSNKKEERLGSPQRASALINKKTQHDRNTSTLLVELNLCRFMYYLHKNRIPLMDKADKQKLNFILQRHIIKLIDKLAETNNHNNFKLADYDQYKTTSAFVKIYGTICEYQIRYNNEFNTICSKESVRYISIVGDELEIIQKYDQSGDDKQFYEKISLCVRQLTKNFIGILDKETTQQHIIDLTCGLSASIEGLRSMLKYLTLLKMMNRYFEDYEYFVMFSSITVLTDYTKSKATPDEFTKLKRLTI